MKYENPKNASKFIDFLVKCLVLTLMLYGAFAVFTTVNSFNERLSDVEATNIQLVQHVSDLDTDINHVPEDEN